MRKVTVFKNDTFEPGKGWTKCEDFQGFFHGWGLAIWEQEPASISYSVALVENHQGMIIEVMPHMLSFDDAPVLAA